MGSAKFNIHAREMLNPLAEVVEKKKQTNPKFRKHVSKGSFWTRNKEL